MRIPKVLFITLLSFSLNAQDTLPKLSLKLFEVNARLGIWGGNGPKMDLNRVSTFTKHKEITSAGFTKGYSDSIKRYRFHEWVGPVAFFEAGFGTNFKFTNTPSRFLKRLRPCVGIYLSSQSLFEYGIGMNSRIKVDSVTSGNPSNPTQVVDSVNYGQIFYTYRSQQAYVEAGALYDVILTQRFCLYSGFILGYGIGYRNTFSVTRDEFYHIDSLKGRSAPLSESVNKSFSEPLTMSTRITVPVGFLTRFTINHKYALSFLVEARPGCQFYKIKGEKNVPIFFATLNTGVRFYFRYFK